MMRMKRVRTKVMIPVAVMTIGLLAGCGASEADRVFEYDMEEVLLDDLDTGNLTDADKQAKYIDYLEAVFEDDIAEAYSSVKSAEVTLSESEGAMQAVVSLNLQEELAEESVTEIAEIVATATGNTATDNIIIQDAEGNILFMKSTPLPESDVEG